MMTTFKRASLSAVGVIASISSVSMAAAQSLFGPVPDVGGVTDARTGTVQIVQAILNFMALIAVVVIVIAGIRLVVSQGDEGAVDSAKKTILYAVIGLIIILLAGAIVDFVASVGSSVN